jgi:hypothetical protein
LLSAAPQRGKLFEWQVLFDSVRYPNYGLGLFLASRYAKLAGVEAFTAIEFGVAGGTGLVRLAKYARRVSDLTGVRIAVAGFDSGLGLPHTAGRRDAPWLWKPADFHGDADLLRRRLPRGVELVLGEIAETFPQWLRGCPTPIGFIAADVDYYSSTKAVLDTLSGADVDRLLPLVSCYFDDILRHLVPRCVGEMSAISEFNCAHRDRQFDRDDWLAEVRPYGERLWLKRMYTLYCFDHPAMRAPFDRDAVRASFCVSGPNPLPSAEDLS